jgi:hypothetical protein
VILLERTKTARPRLKSKGKGLEIRCRANLLPFRAMHYVMAHAKQRACKPRNSNAALHMPRLTAQMRDLNAVMEELDSYGRPATRLAQSEPNMGIAEDPEMRADAIHSAVKAYVDLFYMIKTAERKAYLDSIQRENTFRINPGRNLLLIPALMAELNQPKDELCNGIFYSLYKMPFNVLYDCSKSALHVENLLRNMAIRDIQDDVTARFSRSLAKVESRIGAIGKGIIKPEEDERIKADFIENLLDFSKTTQINIADLVEQRVLTQAAMYARLYRIVRRANY